MTNRIILQPSFVLHSRPYRDTSALVEILTSRYGRLTLLAKGAKRPKSKYYGLLVPFQPLLISYGGRSDLQTLIEVEAEALNYSLKGKKLFIGLYLNELLIKLLPPKDPHQNIYYMYKQTIPNIITSAQPEIDLRIFEKFLLEEIGYGIQLNKTADGNYILPDKEYSFEFGIGFKIATSKTIKKSCFSGKSLLSLYYGTINTTTELMDAKKLLRIVFFNILGNKELKSKELFKLIC